MDGNSQQLNALSTAATAYTHLANRIVEFENFAEVTIEAMEIVQDRIARLVAGLAGCDDDAAASWLASCDDDNALSPADFVQLEALKRKQREITKQ